VQKPDVPGFFSWFGYPMPIEDRLQLIREAGFDRVSIWLGNEEACVSEHRPAELCATAARLGLFVECAHAPYDDCNLLWNEEDSTAVDRALSSIDSPHLGFCYDSSHDFLYARHPTDILRRWGGRLATTHRSDNDGTGDRHWIPGRGTIDWAGIRDALPKRRPLPLSLEVVPIDPGSQSAESFLRESMERGAALVRMMTGGQV
jgi:sugar phosphate isomerase/epimerase